MNCPVCSERMREVEKYGVQLDICPGCKGLWLDRGELEKLLELAASNDVKSDTRPADAAPSRKPDRNQDHDVVDHQDREHENSRRESSEHGYGKQKKRGSWLGDILGGLGGED